MGNCHPSKTNVNLDFTLVDICFLEVTYSHVNKKALKNTRVPMQESSKKHHSTTSRNL